MFVSCSLNSSNTKWPIRAVLNESKFANVSPNTWPNKNYSNLIKVVIFFEYPNVFCKNGFEEWLQKVLLVYLEAFRKFLILLSENKWKI